MITIPLSLSSPSPLSPSVTLPLPLLPPSPPPSPLRHPPSPSPSPLSPSLHSGTGELPLTGTALLDNSQTFIKCISYYIVQFNVFKYIFFANVH